MNGLLAQSILLPDIIHGRVQGLVPIYCYLILQFNCNWKMTLKFSYPTNNKALEKMVQTYKSKFKKSLAQVFTVFQMDL